MRVISFLNSKGGSGKTTLSTNLARAYAQSSSQVLLVDSDPQGSARDWHAARENNPIPLVALDRPNALKNLASVGAGYDVVLVDGAAKLSQMISAAVIIPVQPSPYDIWSISDLVDLIRARQEIADGRPSAAKREGKLKEKTAKIMRHLS